MAFYLVQHDQYDQHGHGGKEAAFEVSAAKCKTDTCHGPEPGSCSQTGYTFAIGKDRTCTKETNAVDNLCAKSCRISIGIDHSNQVLIDTHDNTCTECYQNMRTKSGGSSFQTTFITDQACGNTGEQDAQCNGQE